MNSEPEQQKFGRWLIPLIVIAIVINWLFLNHSQIHSLRNSAPAPQAAPLVSEAHQSPVAPREPTPQEVAAKRRANFFAQYVNSEFERKGGTPMVALVIAAENSQPGRFLTDALVGKFKTTGVDIQPSFFKSAFVSDGLFDKTFNDSSRVTDMFPIANSVNALLLAKESIKFEKNNSALANVLTAHIQLTVAVIPISKDFENQTWSLMANGAGFSRAEAQSNAEERLQKQISSSNMTLTQ